MISISNAMVSVALIGFTSVRMPEADPIPLTRPNLNTVWGGAQYKKSKGRSFLGAALSVAGQAAKQPVKASPAAVLASSPRMA